MELTFGRAPFAGPVAVMFAVAEEARPFLRRLREAGETIRPQSLTPRTRGLNAWTFSGGEIWVTGMGRRNAERAAARALASSPRAALTCGFAGGLHPSWPTGTVLMHADLDFPWAASLIQAGAISGQFCCVDQVAVTPTDKARLRQETQADAVEMESGVIRELCRARRIPAATVRVISDAAHEALPLDFGALMTADHQIHFGRLALTLLRSPSKVGELLRFQRQVNKAAEALARSLASALGNAPCESGGEPRRLAPSP